MLNNYDEAVNITNYLYYILSYRSEHTNNTCYKLYKYIQLPCIIESNEQIIKVRNNVIKGIKESNKINDTIDLNNCDLSSLFYLPYHGYNDKDIMVSFGNMIKNKSEKVGYVAEWLKDGYTFPKNDNIIKIGFISRLFSKHSPHNELLEGIINSLPDLGYEVYIFSFNDMPNENDSPDIQYIIYF